MDSFSGKASIPDDNAWVAALRWHLDMGVGLAMEDAPQNRMKPPVRETVAVPEKPATPKGSVPLTPPGTRLAALRQQAEELAASAKTLAALHDAARDFDGIDIRKTATNFVFSDGVADSDVMVIGEAPGADEDRLGKPFVGVSGQLLDKMLATIGLERSRNVYISNILNWRPPGNRTPSDEEVALSLPFIERHVALVKPKLIILAGGVAAHAILNTQEAISKLRGRTHTYTPQTAPYEGTPPVIVPTFHPSYLLRTPLSKRKAWQDMLLVQSLIPA